MRTVRRIALSGITLPGIALSGVTCLLAVAAGNFSAGLEPTPATGLGPFFPPQDGRESDNDLTRVSASNSAPQGEVFTLQGTVRDTSGRALAGAELIIWQTDIWGKYRHPREERTRPDGAPLPPDPAFQYSGRTMTDRSGHYSFRTLLPGTYGRGVRHIHMRVDHPQHRPLATEVHFAGDLWGDAEDAASRSEQDLLAIPLIPSSDGSPPRGRFDIVLH